MQDAKDRALTWLHSKWVDWIVIVVGWAIPLMSWRRCGSLRERLADVELPRSIVMTTLLFAWVGRRERDRAWDRFGELLEQFGTFIGTRMRESDERDLQVLDLQGSMERFAQSADKRDKWFIELQPQFLEIQQNMQQLAQESGRRDDRLVQLNTRLVVLTIVIAIVGLGGIAATLWGPR